MKSKVTPFVIFDPKHHGFDNKNIDKLILKTGRFDNIDSAVIISSLSKAVQN